MDELLADFIAETREMAEAIAGALVSWEMTPDDRGLLDSIFRFVHTVKGSSAFLDLPRLGALSHAAEDALAQVRDGHRSCDTRMVSGVLAIIDRIGRLTDMLETEGRLPDGDDAPLIAALADRRAPGIAAESSIELDPGALTRTPARSMRLPVELLDRMMAGVSDVVLARNELARALRDADIGADARLAFERLTLCVADIRDAITRTRMSRIDGLFSAFPRMVRDLSMTLGRQVKLETDGGDVELDREMIEMIRDPLTHIIRNAVDHGIEPPQDRIAAGKSATGRLRIAARQAGNQILIDAIDDGRGIDADKLASKAIAAGIITPDQLASMTWARKLDLMFLPGLSTASAVTAISGRGVGMDVVRANIERIGGTVEIDSRVGRGVRCTLRVPLTLTIIPALTVRCGTQTFAIPRSAIDEIVRPSGETVRLGRLGDAAIVELRGRALPLVELGVLLGCAPPERARILVVLHSSGGERFVAAVDAVLDHEELVVKPAAPAIMAAGLFAGTTLPDDSRPMLLLDVVGIAAAAGIAGGLDESAAIEEPSPAAPQTAPTLLFRDLDGRERGARLGLIDHIDDVPADRIGEHGGSLRLAHDGQILPVHAGGALPPDKVRILRLTDGRRQIAYAVTSVIDVIELPIRFERCMTAGIVAGVVLHEGRPIELIDAHWLFARFASPSVGTARLSCRVTGDDSWSREVLTPLLQAAGYDVVRGDAGRADVTITSGTATGIGGPTVRLREDPTAPHGDASIWRYDRIGLLDAVRTAASGAGQ